MIDLGIYPCRQSNVSINLSKKDRKDFDGYPSTGVPCLLTKDQSQTKCAPPLCEACQVTKARQRPTGAVKKIPVKDTINVICSGDLVPGKCV